MSGEPVPSYVMSKVKGLIFDNVRLNGKIISKKDDVPFTQMIKDIENLQFLTENKNQALK